MNDNVKQAMLLITLLVIAISGLMLGTNLTGQVTKEMFCEIGNCYTTCKYQKDCTSHDTVCCNQDNIGICKPLTECKKMYSYNPKYDIKNMIKRDPQRNIKLQTEDYLIITAIITISIAGTLGIMQIKNIQKPFKKKKK